MIQDFYILSSVRRTPKKLIIILHGYGADGKNLLFIPQYWKKILKDTLFVVPNAPFPLSHSEGYEWFNIGDLSPSYLKKGSQEAAPTLRDFVVNIQQSYKIPWSKTIITGFSQGGMLALATGLLYNKLCRGVVSYSGGLFLPREALQSISYETEVCLIHGREDSVVPHSSSENSYDHLIKRNNKVMFHSIPNLGHQMNEAGLLKGAEFIESLAS